MMWSDPGLWLIPDSGWSSATDPTLGKLIITLSRIEMMCSHDMFQPGSLETFRKVPTTLLYDDKGQVLAWGLEAKNASPFPGAVKCEWFVSIHVVKLASEE